MFAYIGGGISLVFPERKVSYRKNYDFKTLSIVYETFFFMHFHIFNEPFLTQRVTTNEESTLNIKNQNC